jgi:hypothetical protein
MATIYGSNYYACIIDKPQRMVHMGEYNGREKVSIDTVTLSADFASGDVARVCQLPVNAKVVGARVFGAALGGGTATLGHLGDGTTPAKADAFIKAIALTAAYDVSDKDSRGDHIQVIRFLAPTDVVLVFSGASSGGAGKQIFTRVNFLLD